MHILIYILTVVDGLLILLFTFGKNGRKQKILIPAVILTVLTISMMFYTVGQLQVFYLTGLITVALWTVWAWLQ